MSTAHGKFDTRLADLAKIHMAKKALGMDDDDYRAMLFAVARVESAADLDFEGRAAVLRHLASKGWKAEKRKPKHKRPDVGVGKRALVGKIEAMLADAKPGRPWSYIEPMVERISKGESADGVGHRRIEWLDERQLQRLVAMLAIDQRRRDARTGDAEGAR